MFEDKLLKFKEVEMLWVARYDYKKEWILEKHCHNYYQIIYFLDGKGEFFLGKDKHSISEGDLFLITPMQSHGFMANCGTSVKTLDMKFLVKDERMIEYLSYINKPINFKDNTIRNLIEETRQEGISRLGLYKEIINITLMKILLIIIRNNEEEKVMLLDSENTILDKNISEVCGTIIEYMENNYGNEISLDDICRNTGYNKSYVCQKFKEELKTTPMKYLYAYRIKKAKELIAYSDYTLKQVAHMTGFMNVHHFTRVFKNIENITPGKWREIEVEGIRKDVYLNEEFKKLNIRQKRKNSI